MGFLCPVSRIADHLNGRHIFYVRKLEIVVIPCEVCLGPIGYLKR